jgi:hypothetical protein
MPALKATQIARFRVSRRVARGRHQDHFYLQRGVAKKPGKLDFRVPFLWHQIEQQQAQWSDVLMHRLFLRHDINLLGMQCLEGWQIVWHFYGHSGSGSWSEVIRATESCQWS